jgi:hypothetical protein
MEDQAIFMFCKDVWFIQILFVEIVVALAKAIVEMISLVAALNSIFIFIGFPDSAFRASRPRIFPKH